MDFNSILIVLAGITGALILLLILTTIAGRVPIHSLLYAAVWAPCIWLSQTALAGAIRPTAFTTAVIFGAWWAFLLGCILPVLAGGIRNAGTPVGIRKWPAIAVLYTLIALQFTGVFFEIASYQKTGAGLNLASIIDDLANMRVKGETAEVQLPLFLGSLRWTDVVYAPLAMLLRFNGHISRRHLLAVFALAVMAALIHFTRAPLVQLSIVIFVTWVTLNRPPKRAIVIAYGLIACALLLAFVASQAAINRESATRVSLDQSLSTYFGMSPLAYEDILLGRYSRAPGIYSFDSVYFFLNKVGVAISYPGQSRPQMWFPLVTNVYTYLDVFTLDAGVPGAMFGAFLVGVFCSALFFANQIRPSLWTLSMYGYACYASLMTPINNEFIRANIPITLALSWLCWLLVRKHPSETEVSRIHGVSARP